MNSSKKTAKDSAFLYLAMAVFSAFSMAYVDPKFRVAGDAVAAFQNIGVAVPSWLLKQSGRPSSIFVLGALALQAAQHRQP